MKTMNFACRICAAWLLFLAPGSAAPAVGQMPADNPLQLSPPRTVTMVVVDLDKEVKWYEDVLGFHENKAMNANPNASVRVKGVELNGFRLHIVWLKGTTRPAPPVPFNYSTLVGWNHISFETTNLDEDYKWLTAHNVAIDAIHDKKTNGLRTLRFHDPEGNEIHIETPN